MPTNLVTNIRDPPQGCQWATSARHNPAVGITPLRMPFARSPSARRTGCSPAPRLPANAPRRFHRAHGLADRHPGETALLAKQPHRRVAASQKASLIVRPRGGGAERLRTVGRNNRRALRQVANAELLAGGLVTVESGILRAVLGVARRRLTASALPFREASYPWRSCFRICSISARCAQYVLSAGSSRIREWTSASRSMNSCGDRLTLSWFVRRIRPSCFTG